MNREQLIEEIGNAVRAAVPDNVDIEQEHEDAICDAIGDISDFIADTDAALNDESGTDTAETVKV